MTAKIKLIAASGGGSFSLQAPSSSSNTRVMTLPDTADGTILTTTNPKSGNIIQVVQSVKTDTFTSTADSFQDVSGLSASITPSSSSNKVLIQVSLIYGGKADCYAFGRLMRDSTAIDIGTAVGNRNGVSFSLNAPTTNSTYDNKFFSLAYSYLDSPSTTSATTYKIQLRNYSGDTSRAYTINRTHNDADVAYNNRGTSKIILMEVAA